MTAHRKLLKDINRRKKSPSESLNQSTVNASTNSLQVLRWGGSSHRVRLHYGFKLLSAMFRWVELTCIALQWRHCVEVFLEASYALNHHLHPRDRNATLWLPAFWKHLNSPPAAQGLGVSPACLFLILSAKDVEVEAWVDLAFPQFLCEWPFN